MTTRILVVLGTRPEIIKLGPVCRALQRRRDVETHVFWTGQHIELARGLLDLFGITVTHNGAEIMAQPGLAGKFALMMQQIETVLRKGNYDWIVVQGDTATAAAAATAGFLNRVPVAHVEAGLRTGDLASPWPEEFNRRVITLASALHFAPTARAAENLRAEGVPDANVMVVGNTVVDALLFVRKHVLQEPYRPIDPVLETIPADKKLILATLHRRENIGAPMREVLRALRTLAEDGDKYFALPLHLNPEVRKEVLSILGNATNVRLLAPLQYPDFVYLLTKAWVVVSDSGGVQEEAPTFGLPILITRETTERPEVIEAGVGRLVGTDYQRIINEVRALTATEQRPLLSGANPFGTGDASERIAESLLARFPQTIPARAAS
ncbi:MAG: UDP-N-acetylglucosamine 2-epimerase (non-hydrolyzing) [Acidobacteriia bacterium]|nr:UDP-N-acetylglucosamine 2-epimerase (non-hydrolyzing) [Methyloceanibacter sp.]MBX5470932.1 UDP-N-acetylglucosamine 2-epimerase (non-hydrolyzing) [Acetobacteraceae bacterium]MCL6491314.1 UDP-N-acetylglucosamine 2-epimerase (non-hydrolyzing) [Terriglobia bacterium]